MLTELGACYRTVLVPQFSVGVLVLVSVRGVTAVHYKAWPV